MAKSPPATAASPLTMWVIHFCFILTVPIYALITHFSLMPSVSQHSSDGVAPLTLVVLSIVEIPLGFLLPSILKPLRNGFSDSPQGELAFNQVRMMIGDALFESIAIYGMVSDFVGGSTLQTYGLMALSLVLLGLNTLRVDGWVARYKQRLKLEQSR